MASYEERFKDWEFQVTEASRVSNSAAEAAAMLGIKFETYKKYAIKYGCYITNQPGKGIKKNMKSNEIPIQEILEGKHAQYQSNKLRKRLIKEGYFEHKCYRCNLQEWQNQEIPLELEHIDGNPNNHVINNLTLLCPNCHALTSTYKGKNHKKQ